MRSIKCYLVFTPMLYRIALFVIYPIITVIAYFFFLNAWQYGALLLPIIFAMAAEILSDYLIFGGIAKRSEEKVEYLKCSNRGMSVFKQALILDDIRRFVWILLINLLCLLINQSTASAPVLTLTHVCVVTMGTYTIIELILMFTRFFTAPTVNLFAMYGGVMIGCIVYTIGATQIHLHPLASILITGIPAFLISVISLTIILKCIGGSYYDGEI